MSRRRLVVVLILALGSGVLAAYSALQYVGQRTVPVISAEPERRSIQVAVAARDLPPGRVVDREDVVLVRWPADAVPSGYATSLDHVVGRGLITPVRTYEPILESKLADGGVGGLDILIPEGMRALSVRVDEVVGVAGYVLPGTRVDVLLTLNPPGRGEATTKVILQNIQALTAGQTIQRDEEGRPLTVSVVTLLVTPERAEKLTLAAAQGRIQLAVRNIMDVEEVTTQGVRVGNLLDGAAPRPAPRRAAAPPARQPDATTIETLRGGARTLIQF
jgi:pilus assembly protein CpaB